MFSALIPQAYARRAVVAGAIVLVSTLGFALPAIAQPAQTGEQNRFGETVIVTATKEAEDKQKIPVSVTAVGKDTLDAAAIHIVSEAAILSPNTFFTDWSARKLSVATFRGISSSNGNNPGVTTYFDGVPQLHTSSSSIELLDVQQVEFVRGPQSALFGRNALGGLVNISTAKPALGAWTGTASLPFGTHGAWAVRGGASGPIISNKLSLGVSFANVERDGFTDNIVTGRDIDSRSAFSGKAQLLWVPNSVWETRVIFTGERARDGDYALMDVGSLRADPFVAARDYEGFTDRDVLGTTVLATRTGDKVVMSSTTGFLKWKTQDATDLDYTPLPIVTRDNREEDFQFTQEVRFASTGPAALKFGKTGKVRWQGGVSVFTQSYDQDAVNSYSPFVVAPFAVSQHSPRSALDDLGVGLFGQATIAFNERLDVSLGGRFDYEHKEALLEDFFDPLVAPPTRVDDDRSFSNGSPQASLAYHVSRDSTVYGTIGRGYKAGGFNAASPAGSESYDEESTLNVEGGVKTLLADQRISANASVFFTDWNDMQLFTPNPLVPTQFYLSNVGGASTKGFELEVAGKAGAGVDLFTTVGYTHARFSDSSVSSGISVGGNKIPNTPDYTLGAGAQYSRTLMKMGIVGRWDTVFYGSFQYNDQNSMGQKAYSLTNLRLGVTERNFTCEVLLRNAFNEHYIPLAFPYPNFAPSGFVGEMGAPRTFSISAGVRF